MTFRETDYAVYRGVPILRREEDGVVTFVGVLAGEEFLAPAVQRVYAWIDETLGPEVRPPDEVEETVVDVAYDERIEQYHGCIIYLRHSTGRYFTPCVEGLQGTYGEIKRAIEDLKGITPEMKKEEEPEFPVIVVEVPSLPVYAAWLKPFIEYIGNLTASVINYADAKLSPLKAGLESLVKLPTAIFEQLSEFLPSLIQKGRNKGADIAVDTLREALAGTEPYQASLNTQVETIQSSLVAGYEGAMNDAISAVTGGDLNASITALEEMKGKILGAAIVNFALHAALEAGTLGQVEFLKDLDPMVISKLGMDQVISRATLLPIEKAVMVPAEQAYNRAYPNQLPSPADLINMVVKEKISLDDFKAAMLRHGIAEQWSQWLWDAHFTPPDYTQIRDSLYRGIITRDEFEELKTLVDLDPRFKAIWDGLVEQIPPYSELVNQRVKEVIDEDEFKRLLQWYGMDPIQADRIWAAHFIPPTLGDLLTAWRRGVISTERLDELMVIVDLDPRFKDIFDTRRYVDPSITMARFMFETGAIDETRVLEIVRRNGYNEEDADDIVHWIIGFQERRFRTSYLRSLATGAVYDAFTEDEVTDAVTDAGYTEEVAEWLLKSAEAREKTSIARAKEPTPKLLSLGELKRLFRYDKITSDDLRVALMTRNYEVGEVDLLVNLLESEKVSVEAGGRKEALTTSELLNAYRYEVINEDTVRIELALRGMEQDDINILLETKKKQWGLE